MSGLKRSALFKRQLLSITRSYRERAGSEIALKFVDQVEESARFVVSKPKACPVYTHLEGQEFRKWGVRDFPVSLFFRIEQDGTVILEALYAHRMNIASRFPDDIK